MVSLKITSNGEQVDACEIPSSWNELNVKQLLYIASYWRIWQMMLKEGYEMDKAMAKLLILLITGKNKSQVQKFVQELGRYDSENNPVNPLTLTNFVFETLDLNKNLIPHLRINFFKKLYGPADALSNMSIIEFSYVLNFYNRYNKYQNSNDLAYMIACMYRPSKKNWQKTGDIREDFNHNTADKYIDALKKLPHHKMQAIYLFFSGCMYAWSLEFKHLFKKAGPETNKTFLDVILSMSGDIFGTFNETKNENAYLVLKELNNRKEAEENKEKKK